MTQRRFSHTYPERFWPKQASNDHASLPGQTHRGIRYEYGDLDSVVELLKKDPETRQAYLPVFFPEDTGAHHGERIPCTLGYHFMIRHDQLHITYYIRSCDFLRHFSDDVYMAMRLASWVADEVSVRDIAIPEWPQLGSFTMHIASLHVFEGDMPRMRKEYA